MDKARLTTQVQQILSELSQRLIQAIADGFGELTSSQPPASAPRPVASSRAPVARPARPTRAVRAAASRPPAGRSGGQGSAADGRRLPAETEADARRFADYVKDHPGLRIRAIGPALGLATKDIALPVARAIKMGLVTKTGQRSATEYFPREQAAAAAKRSRRAKM